MINSDHQTMFIDATYNTPTHCSNVVHNYKTKHVNKAKHGVVYLPLDVEQLMTLKPDQRVRTAL